MNVPAYAPARPAIKTRLAASLFAACFAFILGGAAAHCETKQPASSKDGEYFDAKGNPTYHISPDGKVDWYTYSGFLRYSSECLRCHGPDGMGSSYAPALVDSLKTIDYPTFLATVAGGKRNLGAGQERVMPSLGTDKNVMCYIDDIYVYLKARSDGALGRNRPAEHEPKPKAWAAAQDSCMGSE
ncbi:c-type cytochrome, methanol metabolism-related [Candidatus Rhodoblastus alkanivorans]|uniref:c-type cytochrome, methanol metabolism-related n=1 Tax=Candidatus Rhodoblastus alkanivorans TaxID=2954117 RepID=UPI003CC8A20E